MDESVIKQSPEYSNHEVVEYFTDPKTGLRGIIALHSRKRGPAVGGTRYYAYTTDEDALEDVLKLSRAMSYKCALANVPYGGGKCVLIAPPHSGKKTKEYLESYGKMLKKYETDFYTGEDVGMAQEDIEELSTVTSNIIGTLAKAGDPSPWAAFSVFYALRAALTFVYGEPSFQGKKISIKGLGKVGMELARLVSEQGAVLTVTDVNQSLIDEALKRFPGTIASTPNDIVNVPCDVFAPCALSKDITNERAKTIQAKVICGAANNQLESDAAGVTLFERGIMYVPDYIANAGGLINVVAELEKDGYNRENVVKKCQHIEEVVASVLQESKEKSIAPNIVADTIAKRVLAA